MTERMGAGTKERQRLANVFGVIGLIALVGIAVFLHSSFKRHIWIDEFLVFSVGGLATYGDLFEVIRDTTTTGVNHHQTGVHLTASFTLIKAFGAELWALRIPSYLSALLMFFYAITFIRQIGASIWYQFAVVLAVASQVSLMYYVGEARVYMPLVAAVVGTACYYMTASPARSRPVIRFVGWSAVIVGSSIHPYFLLYWGSLALFGYLIKALGQPTSRSWRGFLDFINPPLVATGSAIYVGLGAITWMRDQPSFAFDIFAATRPYGGLVPTLVKFHFEFLPLAGVLGYVGYLTVGVCFALAVSGYFRPRFAALKSLAGPSGLILVATLDSLLLSASSALNGFYMYPRQWNASLAILPIAFVWLIHEISVITGAKNRIAGTAFTTAAITAIALVGIVRLFNQVEVVRYNAHQWDDWQAESRSKPSVRFSSQPSTNQEWTVFGNENILQGGTVWPEVSGYYRAQ